jgi:stress responsive alpha/beta barrel protein
MIRHVVLFTWTPEATEEQKRAVHAGLATMPAAIGAIRAYKFGPDAGINPANCDYAVVADFDDAAGYVSYRDHPEHRALVENYISPIVASRAAIQFEI